MNKFVIVVGALLTTSVAQARPLRGPYVQLTTPTSATIVWRTSTTAPTRLLYGPTPDGLTTERTAPDAFQHEIRLDDLQPDSTYYYAVDDGTGTLVGGDEDHHFVTAPVHGSDQPFTFWVVGDSGVATAKQARVRDAMLRANDGEPPDVYLHVGDMAYSDGTDTELQERFFEMYPNILRNTVSFPAIGNHENGASDSLTATGPYYDAYVLPANAEAGGLASGSEAYYSWDWGNVHFVVLETYREELRAEASAMLAWLEMDLAATDQKWLVAYFHHPPYTKGSHDSDIEIAHIDVRERMMPMLEAAGVDLVLGGHSHIYERSYLIHGAYDTPTTAEGHIVDPGDGRGNQPYEKLGDGAQDGNVCIVAGHGGTNTGRDGDLDHPLMLMTELINGSVVVAVDGDVMTVKNVRMDGVVSDEFSITRGHALRVVAPRPDITLVAQSTTAIDWVSSGRIASVTLAYSTDNTNWTDIATVDNSGHYEWTVPEIGGETVTVRVRDAGGTGAVDVMDGTASVSPTAPLELVRFESNWRYDWKNLDNSDWMTPTYRDTRWARGRGAFAICGCLPWECACNTYVAESLLSPTSYFRKTFVLPDEEIETVDLSIVHEVGAVVWINGVEVYRRHIDDDSFDAFADPDPLTLTIDTIRIEDATVLMPGENVVAVMVKKSETLGPSLYFDLALTAFPKEKDGCGCTAAASSSPATPWFVVLLLLRRRRKTAQLCNPRRKI